MSRCVGGLTLPKALTVALTTGAVTAILLTGCATTATTGGPDRRLDGQWVLLAASDPQGVIPLDGTHVTLTIGPDAQVSGRGPCSDYEARVIGQPGPVFVTVERDDLPQCAGSEFSQTDERYRNALGDTAMASLANGHLTLVSDRTSLVYARAAQLKTSKLVNTLWTAKLIVYQRSDARELFQDGTIGVDLTPAGRFTLSGTGCPDVTGDWHVNAGELVFEPTTGVGSTCTSADIQTLRDDTLAGLTGAVVPTRAGDILTAVNPRESEKVEMIVAGSTFMTAQ